MRTTVRIDEPLLREAKEYAAREGKTLTAVIEDALRQLLRRRPAVEPPPVELPTFSARLRAGVDLDDSAALLDLMGGADAAP